MLQRINLIPQKPLAVKIKRTTPLLLAALLLLLAAATYLQTFILDRQLAKIDLELTQIQERISLNESLTAQTQAMAATVKTLQIEQNALQLQVDNMSATTEGKRYFSRILAKIASAMPASTRLDKLSFQGNSGTISGLAAEYRDLPGLVARLASEPLFASAALQELGKVTVYDREMFTFNVVFELRQLPTPTGKDQTNGQ